MLWCILICGLIAYVPSAGLSIVTNDVCNNYEFVSNTAYTALSTTIGCGSSSTGVGALLSAAQNSAMFVTADICNTLGLSSLCDGADAAFSCPASCSVAVQNSTDLVGAMITQSTSRVPLCRDSQHAIAYVCSIQQCADPTVACGINNIKAQATKVVQAYTSRPSKATVQFVEAVVLPVSTCSFITSTLPQIQTTLCTNIWVGTRMIAIGTGILTASLVLVLIAAMLSPLKKQPVSEQMYVAIAVDTPTAGLVNYDGPVYGTVKVV